MTKRQMMEEFWKLCDEVREGKYVFKLSDLQNQKRITYGCFTIYDIYQNYHFEKLINTKLDYLTKWQVGYYIQEVKKAFEKMKEFIEVQENLPFEETQMQVAIKEGTIRWI